MSARRRPALLSDKFNSDSVGTYDDIPDMLDEAVESPEYQTIPSIDFEQSINVLSILLRDYQSKHFGFVQNDKTYQVFPFSWYNLEVGDEIKNTDTGETYRVEALVQHPDYKRNTVKLKCPTPPEAHHILRLDETKSKFIRFIPSFPDSEAKPYEFTPKGFLQSNDDPSIPAWVDTITYTELSEPGSRSDGMFSGSNRELRPKYRTTTIEGDLWGQMRDVRLRLDFWTKDNRDSERLKEWYLQFYIRYYWLIEANGLAHFMWVGSTPSSAATRWRTDIIHRSAMFEYRIEHSFLKDLFKIREIEATATIPRDPADRSLKGETISISV